MPGSFFESFVGVEGGDGLLQAVAPDEPHGVVRPAVAVVAQAVDRDDAGMLQTAGDLGLEQESGAADLVVGVVVEDLLEGDLAVQLAVDGDEDGPQAPLGVRPQDAEPLASARRGADRHRGRGVLARRVRADERDAPREVGIAQRGELFPGRRPDGDGGQGLLGVAAVQLELLLRHAGEERAALGVDRALFDEDLGEGLALVPGPGSEGGEELLLVDQADLQPEQPEEQVARRLITSSHGRRSPRVTRRGRLAGAAVFAPRYRFGG